MFSMLFGKRVVIGDGAQWIWELSRTHFPGSVEILDYYHASEHLHELMLSVFGPAGEQPATIAEQWKEWLWEGAVALLVQEARKHLPQAVDRKAARREIEYLHKNVMRMRYRLFRESGLDIGSGRVEAACRTVVGERLKRSGMFWSLPGAENILTYRCAVMSGHYDDFWAKFSAA